jgi:hypothetical protein
MTLSNSLTYLSSDDGLQQIITIHQQGEGPTRRPFPPRRCICLSVLFRKFPNWAHCITPSTSETAHHESTAKHSVTDFEFVKRILHASSSTSNRLTHMMRILKIETMLICSPYVSALSQSRAHTRENGEIITLCNHSSSCVLSSHETLNHSPNSSEKNHANEKAIVNINSCWASPSTPKLLESQAAQIACARRRIEFVLVVITTTLTSRNTCSQIHNAMSVI